MIWIQAVRYFLFNLNNLFNAQSLLEELEVNKNIF